MKSHEIPMEYREILERIEQLESIVGLKNTDNTIDHKESESAKEETSIQIENTVQILIKPKAYYKLAIHALKYANKNIPQQQWVEIIGILTGFVKNENTPLEQLVVMDYWPVGSGDAISVNILEADPVMKIMQDKPNNEFIIGWAHSHPSYTPFLSQDDVNTQLRYQALWDNSIAVVIDPAMISKKNYGFGTFRVGRDRKSYHEIECEVEGVTPSSAYETIALMQTIMNEKT
jgi:proteasome lid subunit RPN8/RPN11